MQPLFFRKKPRSQDIPAQPNAFAGLINMLPARTRAPQIRPPEFADNMGWINSLHGGKSTYLLLFRGVRVTDNVRFCSRTFLPAVVVKFRIPA
ncbi:MAG: hypothetical protein KatS3mg032_0399 [Cyclobacteriaceae bacterium]|nr:MAG: hypothetical protein KatS3mg032_0399 [Cyclobacteriaceae bacterium]